MITGVIYKVGEKEEDILEKEEEKAMQVYRKEMPFSEKIRERFLQREEELLQADTEEERELGEQMRLYRKSRRLALTWGWFVEKNTVAEAISLGAEGECFRIINEIYCQNIIQEGKEDMETVAQIFLRQRSCYERICICFPFLWSIWKRLPDFYTVMSTSGWFPMSLRAMEWELFRGWLETQKRIEADNGPEEISYYRRMLSCFAKRLLEERPPAGMTESKMEEFFEMEPYMEEDETWRWSYFVFLFWQYCDLQVKKSYGHQSEENDRWCERIRKSMDKIFPRGKKFFLELFSATSFSYLFNPLYYNITMKIVNEVYESYETDKSMDLAELEKFFQEKFVLSGSVGRQDRCVGDKEFSYFSQNDYVDKFLHWVVKRFQFTNLWGIDFFSVQMYMIQTSSEEELWIMRKNGFFPTETLLKVIQETRQTKDFLKLPLLIQWMQEA